MATYVWDLGFDFNAVKNPSTNQFFLQHGFVLMLPNNAENESVSVPATPVNLSVGDTIGFNVFNVTNEPTGTFTVTEGKITFQNAVNDQDDTSPFSTTSLDIPQSGTTATGPSVTFSGIQSNQVPVSNPATFPVFTGPTNQTVANTGRFLMHASLTVLGPNGKQTFIVDPEMVVGSAG
jgi:hypothetical protein